MRTVALVLAVLTLMVTPAAAGRGGGFHGSHGFHGHARRHHFHHFHHGFVFVGALPYAFYAPYTYPSCYWQPGYWTEQLYGDRYGNYTYGPAWVPDQWVCSR